MAIAAIHNEIKFGVGDVVAVHQKIVEAGKSRVQVFEGTVIGIKGREVNKTFIVRKIGTQRIGIEQIFPLSSPSIEKIEIKRSGMTGVKHAKLYFTRAQSKKQIERIYSRAVLKLKSKK